MSQELQITEYLDKLTVMEDELKKVSISHSQMSVFAGVPFMANVC